MLVSHTPSYSRRKDTFGQKVAKRSWRFVYYMENTHVTNTKETHMSKDYEKDGLYTKKKEETKMSIFLTQWDQLKEWVDTHWDTDWDDERRVSKRDIPNSLAEAMGDALELVSEEQAQAIGEVLDAHYDLGESHQCALVTAAVLLHFGAKTRISDDEEPWTEERFHDWLHANGEPEEDGDRDGCLDVLAQLRAVLAK